MNVGDAEYKAALRRLNTLQYDGDGRISREQQKHEMDRIKAQLHDAEMRFEAETHAPTMRDLVDDYEQLRNMGDLGGVEIL